ncbi:MAG: TetR/AcrR family transcriptional regulator [Desulfobacteraceae bacterium]|nr:TetR/AcrR family transcriptional regulator [Desulfobacteraceae bacterium]
MGIIERKKREKESRRLQILEAAKEVFSSKGYNAATMEEIADAAELSPGTLYIYFKNKEELHTFLSIDMLKHIAEDIEAVAQNDELPGMKLDNLRDVFIAVYEQDPMILISLFHLQAGETLKNLSEEVLETLTFTSGKALSAITSIINEGIKKGDFMDHHPVALADVLWSLFSGVVLWVDSKRLLNNQKDFVKSTLTTAFSMAKKGLKKD